MRTRTITLIEFDSQELQTLKRIEPSIRIAFPTDAIDAAVLEVERGPSGSRANARGRVKAAKQQWEGRWLKQVCTTRQEWDAKAIHAAWDALVTLLAVLEAQSDRAYWERELQPRTSPWGAERREARVVEESGMGLVAPGTDVCGALAESRAVQLREARDALEILERAKEAVGVPEPHEPMKYEGV